MAPKTRLLDSFSSICKGSSLWNRFGTPCLPVWAHSPTIIWKHGGGSCEALGYQRLNNDTDAKRPPTADKDALLDWDPSTLGLRVTYGGYGFGRCGSLDWGATGATGSVAVDPSTRGLRGATGRSEELPLEKTRATDLEAVHPFAGLEKLSRTPFANAVGGN